MLPVPKQVKQQMEFSLWYWKAGILPLGVLASQLRP
jgi:hypothetical protein